MGEIRSLVAEGDRPIDQRFDLFDGRVDLVGGHLRRVVGEGELGGGPVGYGEGLGHDRLGARLVERLPGLRVLVPDLPGDHLHRSVVGAVGDGIGLPGVELVGNGIGIDRGDELHLDGIRETPKPLDEAADESGLTLIHGCGNGVFGFDREAHGQRIELIAATVHHEHGRFGLEAGFVGTHRSHGIGFAQAGNGNPGDVHVARDLPAVHRGVDQIDGHRQQQDEKGHRNEQRSLDLGACHHSPASGSDAIIPTTGSNKPFVSKGFSPYWPGVRKRTSADCRLGDVVPDVLDLPAAGVGPAPGNLSGRDRPRLAAGSWRIGSSPGTSPAGGSRRPTSRGRAARRSVRGSTRSSPRSGSASRRNSAPSSPRSGISMPGSGESRRRASVRRRFRSRSNAAPGRGPARGDRRDLR